VWDDNFQAYGVRKVRRQLEREGIDVARCTIERLMRDMGLPGVIRGKKKHTTIAVDQDPRPLDLAQRRFHADRPNQLWVADFTYAATWSNFVYVAFVVDVLSRMIVGWRVSTSMSAGLTLEALEQALWARKIKGNLIHHSDRGSQYASSRYSERPAEIGIDTSVGSIGDAAHGEIGKPLRKQRSSGSTGSTPSACLSRSAISLLLSLRDRIMMNSMIWP
jgi:putative transposase